jgi:integrase/recombinase XerD
MLNTVEAYLGLRRAAGFEMKTAECLLKSFAGFAAGRKETHVHTQTAIDWAALGPSVAQRDARLKAVCRFVRFIRVEDGRHEVPPANHFGARKKRRPPHIYSVDEINRLIEAALCLGPEGGLRSQTYATLIALLAVTGLRISEALKLQIADVTHDGLLIRETKFRKTRLTPLHDTAAAGLARYLRRRRRCSSDDHVFVCDHGQPLPYHTVKGTFDRLLRKASVGPASGELCWRLGDEVDQAAWWAGISMTSMPFWNLIPWTTFGNWFSPFNRRHVFAAALTSLNTMSLAVFADRAPFVRTVR